MVLEVNERGELVIPAELVRASPRTRVTAERLGDSVVLKPEESTGVRRFRIEDFPTFPGGPADAAVTFRRDDIYGDDGR